MFITKVKLVGFAAIAGVILGIAGTFLLYRSTEQHAGRILSNREMTAIFGDQTGANNLCVAEQTCACSRIGSACIKCDDENNEGAGATWYICCAANNLSCSESGDLTCDDLFIYYSDTWDAANNCCTPCVPTGKWTQTTMPCKTRKQAQGDACK